MSEFFHSVTLDSEKCKGCINCIKRCPTEAIRVRNGKARIISERCIDCGECIKICPHHAKLPIFDPLSVLGKYEYKVALPAPTLYGQFNNLDDIEIVLNALLKIGFDDVYEVSKGAEIISDCTRKMIAGGKLKYPIISSACPAVIRLISVRFPELLENVLPLAAPMDIAAHYAAQKAMEKTGLPREKIGIIFISPCAAKNSAVKNPIGTEASDVDAVVAIRDVYPKLVSAMDKDNVEYNLADSGKIGVSWAKSGGEAAGTLIEHYLAADGIENVIKVLEDMEDEKFHDLEFVELCACFGGCVGGVLTVENPFVARARLNSLRKYLPVSTSHINAIPDAVCLTKPIPHAEVFSLSDDLDEAMNKMKAMETLVDTFPNLDCGSCGAPSCRALAEDIIRGTASEADCIFRLREHLNALVDEMSSLSQYIPPPFRKATDTAQE